MLSWLHTEMAGLLPIRGFSRCRGERMKNAERRPAKPVGPPFAERGSERADVLRLGALLALGDVELHLLVLVEAAEAARRDRREMGEDVGAAVVRGDEAEALVGVEPLHGTCSHVCSFAGCSNPHGTDSHAAALITRVGTDTKNERRPDRFWITYQAPKTSVEIKTVTWRP